MRSTILALCALAAFILVNACFFAVPEGMQALITQFGEIKGEPITKAGLHMKLPFIHDVRYFERRILSWDGDPEQIPTRDKKYIWVDTTARWRIKDVRKFAETVQSEEGARDRLDGILDGITRDTISNHNLVEAVRNSNTIFDQLAQRRAIAAAAQAANAKAEAEAQTSGVTPPPVSDEAAIEIEEEITGEIERITQGREQLSKLVVERALRELEPFGIELIDIQLRRIAYEKSVEDKVYDRMISERNRIAAKIRSIGKGEEAKIRGKLNRDLKEIESEAYRKSQEVKGVAEARATHIYAGAMKQDPNYYEFMRTMDIYKSKLGQKGRLVLSTDADLLRYLERRP